MFSSRNSTLATVCVALIAISALLANLHLQVSIAGIVGYLFAGLLIMLVLTEYRINWKRLLGR